MRDILHHLHSTFIKMIHKNTGTKIQGPNDQHTETNIQEQIYRNKYTRTNIREQIYRNNTGTNIQDQLSMPLPIINNNITVTCTIESLKTEFTIT